MTPSLLSRRVAFALLLAGAALAYCYRDVFAILVVQWATNDGYSHGFLIPVISLYFVWRRRHRLAALPLDGALAAGTATLALGLGILLLGQAVDVVGIQQLSLLPTLAGLVLLVAGVPALGLLWFPIAYLAFMMPVWDVVTEGLHFPFQQLSAALGAGLLGLIGVPVLHQGTFLHLPNITLEVARVCSGVNYLVAVAAVGVPLAYLAFPDWLRRTLLVAAGLTIAVLANPLRVALIGVFSYFGLSADVHGPGHVFQGLFVAAVGYLALIGGVVVLGRWDRPAPPSGPRTTARAPAPASAAKSSLAFWRAGVAAVLLAGVGIFGGPDVAAESRTAPWLSHLPAAIGDWQRLEPAIAPGPDDPPYVYRRATGERVELRFGPVIHPRSAAADDWTARIARQVTPYALDLPGGGSATVNRAADLRGAVPVLYWYDVDGRIVDNRIRARLHTTWHRLTGRGRAPVGVFVAAGSAAASPDEALAGLAEFARALAAVLPEIPS